MSSTPSFTRQRGVGAPAVPAPAFRRDAVYRRSLAVADLVAATAALLTVVTSGDDSLNVFALVTIPVVVLVSKVVGLYDRDDLLLRKATLDEAPALFRVATLYTFVVWLSEGFFIEGQGVFGRDQLLVLWLLLFVYMAASRTVARAVARSVTTAERCLVAGGAVAAEVVSAKLQLAQGVKAEVVGRVPLSTGDRSSGDVPVLGTLDTLPTLVERHGIDRVVIAPGDDEDDAMLRAVRVVKSCGLKTSVLPRLLEVVGSSVEVDELNGATLLGIRRHGLSRSASVIKRTVDVLGASLGLLVLAPVFAIVAVAIKVTSPGPVFFRQRRMGRNDRVFEMLKFRTMVDGADALKAELTARNEAAEGLFKIADDPRITPIGRLLRRSSLDELPQLWNVLRGEMSLVGPRPLVIEEDRHLTGWHRRRLLVRPGMTGLWQIFGSSRIPLREMVKIDYLYGANWSLWLDCKVLLRTVPYVLARRGL